MCLRESKELFLDLANSMTSNTTVLIPTNLSDKMHYTNQFHYSMKTNTSMVEDGNDGENCVGNGDVSTSVDATLMTTNTISTITDHKTNATPNKTNGNLNEDSMMILSQSIDSIHTVGTLNDCDVLGHQVRTLFVSGLPLDAKQRELYLLFRSFKGYLSSTLKPAGKNGKLTAPVGFVTFESRDQAEEAMSKLQGVKFDPDSNQLMRLEFARSNTKVTKPKSNVLGSYSYLGSAGNDLGASNQFAALNHVRANSFHPTAHQSNSMVNLTGCPTNLTGLMTGLQPSLFAQLAANNGANGQFDVSNGLYAPGNDVSTAAAAAAAVAAAAQWTPIPALSSIGSVYDNAAYLTSAAGLLQANNIRALIPNGFGISGGATSNIPNLQMVQAAIAQANAAALLGSANPASMAGSSIPISPGLTYCQTSTPNCSSSPINSPPVFTSCGPHISTSPLKQSFFSNSSALFPQSQMNSFVSHFQTQHQHQQQQQQQQTLAAIQLNQHATTNPSVQPLGYSNVGSANAGLPPQMAAAALGLLGGYNSIFKELSGNENQLQQPCIQPYQPNLINYNN